MTTLYKKDTKGKIRLLTVDVLGDVLIQESGIVGGKLVRHTKVCTPKNIGKSNETNGAQQARIQMKNLIANKLKRHYELTVEEAENSNTITPMLAKDYFKESHKIDHNNIALQPKLDGVRCMITYHPDTEEVVARTRQNIEIEGIQHIKDEIKLCCAFMDVTRSYTFDGELYVHGKTFQEVTKLVKNKDNEVLEYHIYDLINNTDFINRQGILGVIFGTGIFLNTIRIVPTLMTQAVPLERLYETYIAEGYEGMMVRVKDSMYKINGRSSDLLKYKKFIDISLEIKDITSNDANPKHGTVWVEYNGKIQKTGAKLSHDDREELLINKNDYIGKMAEIRYFEETDGGLMRFPVYHGIRIDK